MSQASPTLIAITLAVSTSAIFYASKVLATREKSLDFFSFINPNLPPGAQIRPHIDQTQANLDFMRMP